MGVLLLFVKITILSDKHKKSRNGPRLNLTEIASLLNALVPTAPDFL